MTIHIFITAMVLYHAGRYLGFREGAGFHKNNLKEYFKDFVWTLVIASVAGLGLHLAAALLGFTS